MKPVFLTLDEILEIHEQQIERYGGSPGVRDAAGLESAVATPRATFGGESLHASIPAMAAAYLFHLCQNHPFLDGNKRTGANAAITFLLMNTWEPMFEEPEFVDLVVAVASGGVSKPALIEIFESRCRPLEDA
ncbi:MAG: type II toxin-antitoxin system death-on-curing family toxin [Bryobacteraceae bacterium]|jgi:death-on-curing protein